MITQPYTVVQPTQRWRRIGQQWYRETIVKLADGSLRLYAIRDEATA